MSKIGCTCGHTIRDQTDNIPYKASLMQDIHANDYWAWVDGEIQSYIKAVERNDTAAWMQSRGRNSALFKNHGQALGEVLNDRYSELNRSVFECESCGRLLVESHTNQFQPYSPDSRKFNALLAIGENKAGN